MPERKDESDMTAGAARNFRKYRKLFGAVVAVLGVMTIGEGVWYQYTQSEQTQRIQRQVSCQYGINQQFLSLIKTRSGLSERNQQNINTLILQVSSDTTDAQRMRDYQNYLTNLKAIQNEQSQQSYPSFTTCG